MQAGNNIFHCTQCGQCCEGKGGIVLSPHDLSRLAAFLNCSLSAAIDSYCEHSNGKLKLRTGQDGFCIFFRKIGSCTIHKARPDICRAWPYFRGNLIDPSSLAMARDYCPGISKTASFAEFAAEGLRYLRQHGLIASDPEKEAFALILDETDFRIGVQEDPVSGDD